MLIVKSKLRVIFDQDDVLADFLPAFTRLLNMKTGRSVKLEEITHWDLDAYWGENSLRHINSKGFFYNLKPKKDSLEVFPSFYRSDAIEVFVITACHKDHFGEKKEWMKRYFPDFPMENFIASSDKTMMGGDYLVDDGLHNAIMYKKTGVPILYDMPHNRMSKDFHRIYSLKEVRRLIGC